MKPELHLTERAGSSGWRDPAPAAPAGPSRNFWAGLIAAVTVACLAMLLSAGQLRPRESGAYRVSVPLDFKPFDPERWAIMNSESYADALKIDPSLPDPRSIDYADATALPPVDPAALRDEAFVGPPAKPYVFRGASATDRERAHYCLTAAVYYEAGSETDAGMRGVAQTVLNRVRHPSFPNSVCGVVFQGSQRAGVCQFTFACDGAMARAPNRAGWLRASRIASAALGGAVFPGVGLATHYHTTAIWPRWGQSLVMTNIVGAHIFHRWRGRWGMPDAFRVPYLGREPVPGPYLAVADQLAARALGTAPTALLPAGSGSTAAPLPDVAPAPLPSAMAQGDRAIGTPVPGAKPAPAQPTYADPRLNRSGEVRDEFQNSGEWIR
ncbi:cell wall hydrolase [Sphingopyxis indica]|uniref:Cell wall hydrolase CwlJ, involved in spore germination n=1 Tax=Sphingopyxis indica TaxID=436663 RepID=A0A239GDM8_9SPHN|nr:cell wall hydrolase [Sphingopyxis indica]SNS67025.1 Cell wall hydrolase CwlJ, involved in spore germination [Sphingopyxis indica]